MTVLKKASKTPKKKGRKPLVFDYDKIYRLARLGLNNKDIANCIGCNPCVFYEKKANDPKLVEALENGKSALLEAVASKIVKAALEDDNFKAQALIMTTIGGWTQKQDLNVTNKTPVKLVIKGEIPA